MLQIEDLFQRPYYYITSPIALHPRLAHEIASLERLIDLPVFLYRTVMLDEARGFLPSDQESGRNYGFGASPTDPSEALTKSVFEAFERKFSKAYDPSSLVVGSHQQLSSRAADPKEFSLISAWERTQSPLDYVPYNSELKLSWANGYQVTEQALQPMLLPAALVYSRFAWQHPQERFVPNLSPGLACHFTYREAMLHGLYELIERDAFMLVWMRRQHPPHIQADSIELATASTAHATLSSLGFRIHFLDITSDIGVPVFLCLIEHANLPWDGTLIPGLGCHLDPHAAARKALLEAIVMLSGYAEVADETTVLLKRRPPLPYGLSKADYFRNVRFLLESSSNRACSEIAGYDRNDAGRNLEFLIRQLNDRGHAVYFVDLTPIGYENCRFCLTRAMVTGLQPMLYEPDCWRINAQRLFGNKSFEFDSLNVLPHPFMLME